MAAQAGNRGQFSLAFLMLALSLWAILGQLAHADIVLPSTISTNQTYTLAGSPVSSASLGLLHCELIFLVAVLSTQYIVSASVVVVAGATIRFDPGCVIKIAVRKRDSVLCPPSSNCLSLLRSLDEPS